MEEHQLPIEIRASNPDKETLKRCREIMEELKKRADFPTIGGNLSVAG